MKVKNVCFLLVSISIMFDESCCTTFCSSTPLHQSTFSQVLTLEEISYYYPIISSYQFNVPEISLSCYCQCSHQECQFQTCPLCYTLYTSNPGCTESVHTPSSTCCTLRILPGEDTHTGIQLGYPIPHFQFSIQHFLPTGRRSSIQKIIGNLFRQMDMNSEQEQNLSLPGWLKVKDGNIHEVPFNQITKAVHISTLNCEQQKFKADTYGVFTKDDWISTVSQKQLEESENSEYKIYESGNEEVVENGRKGDKVKFVLEGPELDVTLFQNSTILSKWEVVRTYRVPLHSTENSTDSTQVCVHHHAQDNQECRVLQLEKVYEKEERPLWTAKSTTVNAIPIVWKALTNQPSNLLNSLTGSDISIWNLDKFIPEPILIIIQSFLAIIVIILCIKIILCVIPKCKSNS